MDRIQNLDNIALDSIRSMPCILVKVHALYFSRCNDILFGYGQVTLGAVMQQFSETAHWRDSGRTPRFLIVDARAALPIFIFFMHISWWTFSLFVISMVFFSVVEHFGFSISVFLRWLRGFLAGSLKTSQPWWYH